MLWMFHFHLICRIWSLNMLNVMKSPLEKLMLKQLLNVHIKGPYLNKRHCRRDKATKLAPLAFWCSCRQHNRWRTSRKTTSGAQNKTVQTIYRPSLQRRICRSCSDALRFPSADVQKYQLKHCFTSHTCRTTFHGQNIWHNCCMLKPCAHSCTPNRPVGR